MKILFITNYKAGRGGISGQVEILTRKLNAERHSTAIFSTLGNIAKRLTMPVALLHTARHYDILHVHCCSGWGFLPAVFGITIAKILGKKIVVTYHGGGGGDFFDKHPKLVRHFLLHSNNIVLSGYLEKVFARHNIPCTIIPNIIELDPQLYRQREIIHPNFISIRTLTPLYQIDNIIKAFAKVQQQIPDATLTIVGGGTEKEKLEALSAQQGIQNTVFTGRVANSEIYKYLDQADIMLSAPKIDNMPVSILEGVNAGLLIISSNVGGVPYMITDNESGMLFESGNVDMLSQKMLAAVERQDASLHMIQQARTCLPYYCWDSIKTKIYSIYQD